MSKNKANKSVKIIIILVVAALIAGVCGYGYTAVKNDINGKNQKDIDYTLVIESKDFEYEVAQMLFNNKVVISSIAWTNWMDKYHPDFVFINGEYQLNANMSYEEIFEKLNNPDISHEGIKVTFPEGKNCMEMADILEENGICSAKDFLEVCKSKDGFDYDFLKDIPDNELIGYQLEGFLFPATYNFAKNSDAKDVAAQMLEAFDEHITDDMTAFCKNNNMTLYELVTLASIVQEEALTNDSAKNIASVFMNRLSRGMKLESDVTYFYAAKLRDEYGFSQEVYDSYYTYRCQGLPSGPITNSGDAIMSATVNYPKTDYIYFYSDLNQEFHFAKSYDEFLKLQQKYPWKED